MTYLLVCQWIPIELSKPEVNSFCLVLTDEGIGIHQWQENDVLCSIVVDEKITQTMQSTIKLWTYLSAVRYSGEHALVNLTNCARCGFSFKGYYGTVNYLSGGIVVCKNCLHVWHKNYESFLKNFLSNTETNEADTGTDSETGTISAKTIPDSSC